MPFCDQTDKIPVTI